MLDPTITVRVNGAAWLLAPTVSCSPAGLVWKVKSTVWGSRRMVSVSLRPPESVAVSVSSRYDGYSWSGPLNEPEATSSKVWTGCWWQPPVAQWCSTSDQDSPEAGTVPS